MKKTYKISDHIVNHPTLGELKKRKITYYHNGDIDNVEYYDESCPIREGYTEEANQNQNI